mmetsp:Transcript_22042/g.53968  ORF Transcript_22042/g.53968 Transcript_22042/m.53968 type:complete len:233 (+) Transcript_22042:2182-2880(+)
MRSPTTSATFGESAGRNRAALPRQITTPSRTRSATSASASFFFFFLSSSTPFFPFFCGLFASFRSPSPRRAARYASSTGRTTPACPAPYSSMWASPASSAPAHTPSSRSASPSATRNSNTARRRDRPACCCCCRCGPFAFAAPIRCGATAASAAQAAARVGWLRTSFVSSPKSPVRTSTSGFPRNVSRRSCRVPSAEPGCVLMPPASARAAAARTGAWAWPRRQLSAKSGAA